MLFKLSNLNSNLALTLGYLNPALNNSAQLFKGQLALTRVSFLVFKSIFSDNFLYFFNSFQSSTCRQKE